MVKATQGRNKQEQMVSEQSTVRAEVADEVVDAASSTPVAEYTKTAAELAKLRQRYANVIWDCTDKAQEADARRVRRELVSLRTSLDKMRLNLNEADRRRIDERNSEARRIEAEIRKLESPIDEAIRSEEQRKEREKEAKLEAERVRVEALRASVLDISSVAARAVGLPAAQILEKIALVERIVVDQATFAEMVASAASAKDEALRSLRTAHGNAVRAEEAAAEAERNKVELERLRKEAADRLAAEEAARAAEAKRLEAERVAELQRRETAAAAERKRLDEERQQREAAERAQRERAQAVQGAIDAVRALARGSMTATSDGLQRRLDQVRRVKVLIDVGDLIGSFEKVRDDAIADLTEMLATRVAQEAEAAARAADAERQAKITEWAGIAAAADGLGVADLESTIWRLEREDTSETRFGPLHASATAVKGAALAGLRQLLEVARTPAPPDPEPAAQEEDLSPAPAVVSMGGQSPAVSSEAPATTFVTEGAPEDISVAIVKADPPEERVTVRIFDIGKAGALLAAAAATLLKSSFWYDIPINGGDNMAVDNEALESLGAALAAYPLPNGMRYSNAGLLLNADGTRSTFCDVDE